MREQLLAANNLLMGTTNILLIGLPDTWRVASGHAGPEVEKWAEHRGRRWMIAGHAPYRLVEPHPEHPGLVRAEVELLIQTAPLGGSGLRSGSMEDQGSPAALAVCGHDGLCIPGSVVRGLWPRRREAALEVAWTCAATGRRLLLRLTAGGRPGGAAAGDRPGDAAAGRAVLDRVLAAVLAGVQCH